MSSFFIEIFSMVRNIKGKRWGTNLQQQNKEIPRTTRPLNKRLSVLIKLLGSFFTGFFVIFLSVILFPLYSLNPLILFPNEASNYTPIPPGLTPQQTFSVSCETIGSLLPIPMIRSTLRRFKFVIG
jgi:hypothetical protein